MKIFNTNICLLGFTSNRSPPSKDKSSIHTIKRTTNMKTSAMKSDLINKKISIHNRISLKNNAATTKLTSRIQRFEIDPVKPTDRGNDRANVFSRLH